MAKTQIKNYIFTPGMSATGNLFPNAYSFLNTNKTFIQKEATAWIADQVTANAAGFIGYTYNQAKCERDVGYIVDAYLNDLRFGGNEKLYNTVKYYWDQDVAQVDGDRQPEIQTHTFIGTLITNYILANTLYSASNTEVAQTINVDGIVAESNASTKISTLVGITVAVITNGLSSLPTLETTGVGRLKFQGKHNLDELLLITNTTNNEIIYNFSNIITGASVEFITSGIATDYDFPTFLQTTDGITVVTLNYDTSAHNATDDIQIFVEKIENGRSVVTTRPYDFGTDAIERPRAANPLSMLDADFEYGLQPTKWAAISTMRGYPSIYEIPGTDTQVSTVITDASFGNTTEIFDITFTNNSTSDFRIVSGTDRTGTLSGDDPVITVTEGDTITILANTGSSSNYDMYFKTSATHDSTTDLVEGVTNQGAKNGEYISWTTKLGDAGTYFYLARSYGNMRGIITVVAGEQGAGVGQSQITVTTVGPHGLETGDPITIKSFEDSVAGVARAEGSFVVVTVPDTDKFTYFAKAKVGTTPGTVIANSYTQLRQAGFYTGANIGDPVYTIITNGQEDSIILELGVEAGSTIIPFDGVTPDIGSTLSGNVAIGTDSQVTGILDTSAGGGEYLTVEIDGDVSAGATSINVVNNSGIVAGLALDRGDGTAVYVTGVNTNTVNISGPLTSSLTGNQTDYIGVSGFNVTTIGSEASLTIVNTSSTYSIDSFQDAGFGYAAGDRLSVPGNLIGGETPDNDLEIIVDTVVSDGSIETATLVGTGFAGVGSASNLTPVVNGGAGSGAVFNATYTNNVYTVTLDGSDASTDFIVNDQLNILGTLVSNGATPANDILVKITTVDASGTITGFTATGTAPDALQTYVNPSYTGGTGTTAQFNATKTGTTYTIAVENAGIDYVPTDTITILGTALGGTTPANDLTITIDNVGASGEITTITVTGVATNTAAAVVIPGQEIILGSGFDVSIALNSGSYTLGALNNAGTNYATGQTFNLLGTSLLGVSPANNLVITISTVDASGAITGVTFSGTANSGNGTFAGISPINSQPIGTSSSFDITRDNESYTVLLNAPGDDYEIGNRILISGALLGGVSPLNDLEIKITGATAGVIDTFSTTFIQASFGAILRLISTITISEPLTQALSATAIISYVELATIEITFPNAHGLVPGNSFISTIGSSTNDNNHDLAAGSFIVTDIPTKATLRYQARANGLINVSSGDIIRGEVYPRPDSFFVHRPFDGGVMLGTGGPQHGAQAIRQSKKYIRYQSGKGIMYTTGALFAPSYDIRSVTATDVEVGSEITIVTDDNDHGCQIGGIIRLLGVETPGYSSGSETAVPPKFDYEVTEVVDERTFKVLALRRLGATNAVLGFGAQMSVVAWHGATVRSGIFDDQNGIFWEFDGTQINVVQRTGTYQVAGTIAIDVDKNSVVGTNTRFRDQLKAGDRIVIRGMTHVVSHVIDQTNMTVTPDFRGVTNVTGAKAMIVFDKRTKQADFNLDRLDGTGPSGYDIDIAKMQMIGIQYSWYGAGFIDFMLRGSDGNFVFAHRMRNSNVNTEAFMRSGNLPVRYEVANEGPSGKLKVAMTTDQLTIELVDSSFFPTAGTTYIDNEIITFTGNNKATNTLTGCTRSAVFTNFQAGANRSYTAGLAATHADRTGVILISQTITPLISHWGSAFITDGGFDEDRGYIFSYAETAIEVSTTKRTAFMIRLAPSVSNALIGDLGERELLNRAQLLLTGLEVTSESGSGGIVIEGVLNPQNYPNNPNDVTWTGLSTVAQGGQPSFAQIAAGGGISWTQGQAATTANITAQPNMTATLDSSTIYSSNNNSDYVYVSASDYRAVFGSNNTNSNVNGKIITGTNIPSNTYIRYGGINSSGDFGYFRLSKRTTGPIATNSVDHYTITFSTQVVNKNFGYFTLASFYASGGIIGTSVTGGSVTMSANTSINNVSLETWAGNSFYTVRLNNSFSGTLAANTGTFQLSFAAPNFAAPGETIFSFIAVPGERSTLDLNDLKELTNTPLGGRGTYPNGPDVLAINVYKVSGSTSSSNIILRWGEAQA